LSASTWATLIERPWSCSTSAAIFWQRDSVRLASMMSENTSRACAHL
jgi:hypothetical protein